jgi:hypothetical protein
MGAYPQGEGVFDACAEFKSEPVAGTPSRRCRTPPFTCANATVDEGEKGVLLVYFLLLKIGVIRVLEFARVAIGIVECAYCAPLKRF